MDHYKQSEKNKSRNTIGFKLKTESEDVFYNLVPKKEQDSHLINGAEVPLGKVCGVKQEIFDPTIVKEAEGNMSKQSIGFNLKTESDDVLLNLVLKGEAKENKSKDTIGFHLQTENDDVLYNLVPEKMEETSHNCEGATRNTTSSNQQPAVGPCAYNILNVDYTSDKRNSIAYKQGKQYKNVNIGKMFDCSHCTYKTNVKKRLTVHLKTHTNEKPFVYSQCAYKSAHRGALLRHMKTHINEKPLVCSQCTYRSAYRNVLVNRMKTHTGGKSFACSQCTNRPAHCSTFVNHMKTHTNEKPYACNECAYRSAQRSTLIRHMKIHTN